MGKSATFDNDLLLLIFNATTIANIAINATSSPLTSLYVSLHTANPGTNAPQTTSEAAYTSYARQAVTRSGGGFTVTANAVSPAANVTFPAATGGSEIETYFGIGTAISGTGKLLYSGAISPTITVVTGVQPILTTASTVTET
jgi:hypothetical protein